MNYCSFIIVTYYCNFVIKNVVVVMKKMVFDFDKIALMKTIDIVMMVIGLMTTDIIIFGNN